MARISIVIPTYNRPAKLRRALQSCFAQTIPAHEIIVVDNGNNPLTGEVVESCKPRAAGRLSYHRSEPFKARAAVAHGIAQATGDWIINLDDDDFLVPDRVERDEALIATLAPNVVLIAHDFLRVDFQNKFLWQHTTNPALLTLENALCLDHFGPPPASTWRANVIQAHHPFHHDEGWFDYDLVCSGLQHGRAVASGRVGYVMDDTRSGVRETLSSDKPVRLALLHRERYRAVPARFQLSEAHVERRIAQQAAFQAGRQLRWRALGSAYKNFVYRHPVEFLKGLLAPLRYTVSRWGWRFLPVMRGSISMPLAQFARRDAERAAWIEAQAGASLAN